MNRSQRDEKGRFRKGNQLSKTHGGTGFLQSGKLPAGRKSTALRKELRGLRIGLESLCPERNVRDDLLIASIIKLQGFTLLFELFLKESGCFDPEGLRKRKLDYQPGFKTYLQMLGRQGKALDSLGISKQEKKELLTPLQIVEKEEQTRE